MKKLCVVFVLFVLVSSGSSAAPGPFGNALSVTLPEDYTENALVVKDTSALDVLDSNFTLEAWICIDYINPGDLNTIISNDEYELHLNASSSLYGWTNGGATIYGKTILEPDKWYHVAFVCGNQEQKLYVNGVLDNSLPLLLPSYVTPLEGSDLLIGNDFTPREARQFNGYIDEVRIWRVARTQEQIQAKMNDTLNAADMGSFGLIAYYRFDKFENLNKGTDGFSDNLEDDIRDFGASQLHGDISGIAKLVPYGSIPSSIIFAPVNSYATSSPHLFVKDQSIFFELPKAANVQIRLYDVQGKIIKTILNQQLSSGFHSILWDGKDEHGLKLSPGIYFWNFQINGQQRNSVKKIFKGIRLGF